MDTPPGKLTVSDYAELWLTKYVASSTAATTQRRYEQLLRLHVLPSIGDLTLAKLRPLHIQDAYSQMLDKGLSPRTVVQAHRVLREALHQAVRWQLLGRNPADAVEPPRFPRFEPKTLAPADLRRLLDASATTRYGPLIRTAAATGLRLGELLGLRWQDVDLDARVLHVRQTCQWLPGSGYVFGRPKTHRSSRPVALPRSTAQILREQRNIQLKERLLLGPAYVENDLVFATERGTPVNPSNLRRAWLGVLEKADLSGVRFHDLRHTHATLLLLQGVHPKVVSERLGHAGIAITMDVYSHVLPGLQTDAADRFDEVLSSG